MTKIERLTRRAAKSLDIVLKLWPVASKPKKVRK